MLPHCSRDKLLLSTCYVPSPVLGAGDSAVNRTQMALLSWSVGRVKTTMNILTRPVQAVVSVVKTWSRVMDGGGAVLVLLPHPGAQGKGPL